MQTTRRSILKTATAIAIGGTGITAARAIETDHPDRALLLLGEKMDEAIAAHSLILAQYHDDWSAEADEICMGYADKVGQVVKAIERTSASTVDGLRVKARAIQWCFLGDTIEFGSYDCAADRLAAQIVRALLEA